MSGAGVYKDLLSRYLEGALQSQDLQRLMAMTRGGRYDEVLRQTVQEWQERGLEVPGVDWSVADRARLYQVIKKRIKQAGSSHKQQSPRRIFRWRAFLAAAAVAGLLGWMVYLVAWPAGAGKAARSDTSSWVQYSNPADTHEIVSLADGSRVTLWPGAAIRFRMDTLRRLRLLQLQGSAGFDVARRNGWAFEVMGHGMAVAVLGTRFTVADHRKDARVEVTVHSGKVQVSPTSESGGVRDDRTPMILLPNHKAEFNKQTGQLTHTLADEILPMEALGPHAREVPSLDFRQGVSLSQLMQALEQVYGVSIAVQGKTLQSSTMMGNFSGKELHDILDIICISLNTVYAIEADSIVMKPKPGG